MGETVAWKEFPVSKLIADRKLSIGDGYRAKNIELTTVREGAIPFARAGNINGGFSFDGADCFPRQNLPNIGDKISKVGDTVFTSKGTVGRFAYVSEEIEQFVYSPQLCFWRSLDDNFLSPRYLYYWMQGHEFLAQVDAVKGQTDMAEYVSLTDQRQMKITLPDPPEQKAIAEVLSSLDDKIDLLHRQNKTLESLAQTLFRQWFIEGADESWEIGKLGDVISIFDSKRIPLSAMERDKRKVGELYPYYGAASIMDYVNDYIFDGEYLLMGEDGTVQTEDGKPILQMPTGKFWVNNHAHVLQAKEPFTNYFLYIFLRNTDISHAVTGAVQPKINQENLKAIKFPIPTTVRVEEFVSISDETWNKIKSNNKRIQSLTVVRDALLPKLMSGEATLT